MSQTGPAAVRNPAPAQRDLEERSCWRPEAAILRREPRTGSPRRPRDGGELRKRCGYCGAEEPVAESLANRCVIPAVRSPDGCPAFVLAAGAGPSGLTEAGMRPSLG